MNMEIYIGNISHDASPDDLYEALSPYDSDACVKVVERQLENGNVIIYGHARIEDEAAARKAIAELNGTEIMGVKALVREFQQRDESDAVTAQIRERRQRSVYTLEAKRCEKEAMEG